MLTGQVRCANRDGRAGVRRRSVFCKSRPSRADVTIPVVLPIPTERMIMVLVGQNLIMGQGRDDGDEVTLQRLPVRPLGFALVVTLELACVFNPPHSGPS